MMERLRNHGLSPWYLPRARVTHFVPAEKCTLKHIAARAEAYGHYCAVKSEGRQGPMICRIPHWAYKRVLVSWAKWVWAKARGREAYAEYLEVRHHVGAARGFREVLRASSKV